MGTHGVYKPGHGPHVNEPLLRDDEVRALLNSSGLPFCKAFVVMNFHLESVDFVMDFCVNFFCGFLWAFCPFNEGQKIHREIHSNIHDRIPAKSTHAACSEKRRRKIHSAGRGAREFLASDSAITIAQFRPFKVGTHGVYKPGRGPHVNEPLFRDDEVGALLTFVPIDIWQDCLLLYSRTWGWGWHTISEPDTPFEHFFRQSLWHSRGCLKGGVYKRRQTPAILDKRRSQAP